MTMIRKQFFIDRDQSRRLKRLAAAKGVAEGEIIRVAIEHKLQNDRAELDDWRNGLNAISGSWADRHDMQDFVRKLRKGSGRRLKRLGLMPGGGA